MYNQSARPQVQYTLDTLSSTLYQLMESQPFSEITVTALCRAAGVGRQSQSGGLPVRGRAEALPAVL